MRPLAPEAYSADLASGDKVFLEQSKNKYPGQYFYSSAIVYLFSL